MVTASAGVSLATRWSCVGGYLRGGGCILIAGVSWCCNLLSFVVICG